MVNGQRSMINLIIKMEYNFREIEQKWQKDG